MNRLLCHFLVLLTLIGCTESDKLEISRSNIVGTWSVFFKTDSGMPYPILVETTYLEDGRKCTVFVDFDSSAPKVSYAVGKWKLDGNVLIQWSTKSNADGIPLNMEIKDTINWVTISRMELLSHEFPEFGPGLRYKMADSRADSYCEFAS